jgi:hypothetical protein
MYEIFYSLNKLFAGGGCFNFTAVCSAVSVAGKVGIAETEIELKLELGSI